MWSLFIPPALQSRPSALSHESSTDSAPQFTDAHFDQWLEFQRKRGKAVSKDTWALLLDFIRSIDAEFKEYDESGKSAFMPSQGMRAGTSIESVDCGS